LDFLERKETMTIGTISSALEREGAMTKGEPHRLDEDAGRLKNWKRWGPFLSERQWATVRVDYSPDGKLWESFPYEHAMARAYRWGEDGLLGMTDPANAVCASRWHCGTAKIRTSRSDCSASRTRRGSFTHHFRSKEAFWMAW